MRYSVVTNDTDDGAALPIVPSSIWILSTLEIALSDGGGSFLLLTFPSYALADQSDSPSHDEGYWAPPFVAYPVPLLYSPPSTVGSMRRLIEEHILKIDIIRDLEHLCYQMGLRDVRLERREGFVELKVSPRSPSLVKAYYILRHGLVGVDASCLRNLADPEVRRGYVYLPIQDEHLRDLWTRHSPSHDRDEKWFLGKPIQSNVQHVLNSADRASAIVSKSFKIEASKYARSETGLIWVVDLSGYGNALKYVGTTMHSFQESGKQAQDFFRQEVTEQFHIMLAELNVTQVQIAGDGFIATFPERVFKSVIETLDRIIARWRKFLIHIETLNAAIRDPDRRVGSRMILHTGQYRFGRIGGARSFSPAFDGNSIIEAARLDQGLGTAIKPLVNNPPGALNHFAAVSNDLNALTSDYELSSDWKSLGAVNLCAKEFQGQSKLYRLCELAKPHV